MNSPKSSTPEKTVTEDDKAMTYLSLKTGKANKTGQRSHGQLYYRVLTDADHQHLYLTLTGNDGGGYYSKEIVPFDQVEHCLEGFNTLKPISSKLFQPAFIGQSSNNAGFLAAILRAEKLLVPVAGAIHQHAVQPDWEAWKAKLLALADEATSYQPEPPKPKGTISKSIANKESEDAERIPDTLEQTALSTDITNQDNADQPEGIETIATVLDKHQAKKQRPEKRPHPTLQEQSHDSVA